MFAAPAQAFDSWLGRSDRLRCWLVGHEQRGASWVGGGWVRRVCDRRSEPFQRSRISNASRSASSSCKHPPIGFRISSPWFQI